MKQLFDEYGYCIIPKGTPLFRTDKKPFFEGGVFFALKACNVPQLNSEGASLLIQKWIAKQDIRVLFAITDIEDREPNVLANIYNKYVADSEKVFGDLCIKNQKDLKQINFVKYLREKGINGWFATIEGMSEFEICLFYLESELSKRIELENQYRKETLEEINSLEYLEPSPSERFWQENKELLAEDIITDYKVELNRYLKEKRLSPKVARANAYKLKVKLAENYLAKPSMPK